MKAGTGPAEARRVTDWTRRPHLGHAKRLCRAPMRSLVGCACVRARGGGYGGNGRFAYERGRLENFRRNYSKVA